MELDEGRLKELADEQGASVAALRALLLALHARAGAEHFYIFWLSAGGMPAPGARRPRTLLAFRTPDAALVFAQRNQFTATPQPRLRRLPLLQLVQAVLREPAIGALLLVADEHAADALPAGQLPPGVRIERADLLAQLATPRPPA